MADLNYRQMASEFLEALKELAGGGNSGTPSAGKPAVPTAPTGDMGAFNKGATDFLALMTRDLPLVAAGFLNVRNSSDAAKNSLFALGGVAEKFGGVLGKALTVSGKLIEEYREAANQANKVGIGQLNYAQLTEEAQKAGYKNGKDYLEQLAKTSGNSLKSIDQSNELSSRKFLEFAKDVQGSEKSQKLKNLAGFSREEIAQIAAIAAGGKTTQLNSEKGKEELGAKTDEMANNINRLVEVTGRDRGEIIASMQEYNKSARGQLELQAVGNDQTRDALQAARLTSMGLGQAMQDITSTVVAGGALTKDQRTQLQVSTGGRAGQYMRAARDVRRTAGLADDDPGKIAAQDRLRDEVARANDYQNSKQFARQALTTQDPNRKAAIERAQAQNTQKFGQGATQRAEGLSPEEAQRAQLIGLGDAAINGRTQEGRARPYGQPGTQNEGARINQAINSVYESAAMNAASASGEIRKLNQELGQAPEKIEAVRKEFQRGFGNNTNQDESDKRLSDSVKKIGNVVAPGAPPEVAKERQAAGEGPTMQNRKGDKREHGTLGEIGQVTEPKDIVAKLHKGETVVTPEQLKNLLSGSASNAISDVMKSATTNQPSSGGLDVSKITSGLKEITTTISSVSGGGSTTRSTVENDDAKAAKKELEAVKAQFQTEKNDIRTQVKGNLGPDAKHTDIMRAMRDNPEAKALEARMQEATAKLSTRISDGTTSKTVIEPGANTTQRMSQANVQKTAELAKADKVGPVSIADIQKSMAQGMSQADTQKKAELKTVSAEKISSPSPKELGINKEKLSAPSPKELGINKEKISSPLTVFESMFDKLFSNKSKVDDTIKINSATESGIDKIKLNDATTPTIDSVSNNLSDTKNKKELEADLNIDPEITKLDSGQQSNSVGLNDLNEQLIQLNTSIRQLIEHSADTVETAGKQVKATKRLSGNRFA